MSDRRGPPLDYEPPAELTSDRQPFSRVALVLVLFVPMAIALLAIVLFVVIVAQHALPKWVWPTVGLVFLLPPTIVAIAFLRRGHRPKQ